MTLDLTDIIRSVCPHCRAGKPLAQRESSKEWTHQWQGDRSTWHQTLCMATHLRNDPAYRELIR